MENYRKLKGIVSQFLKVGNPYGNPATRVLSLDNVNFRSHHKLTSSYSKLNKHQNFQVFGKLCIKIIIKIMHEDDSQGKS